MAVPAAVRPDLQLQKLVSDHFGGAAPSVRLAPSKTQTVKVSLDAQLVPSGYHLAQTYLGSSMLPGSFFVKVLQNWPMMGSIKLVT